MFSRPKTTIGLDVGTHSVKTVLMSKSGGRLHIEAAGYAPVDRNQMNIDPLVAQSNAIRQALAGFQVSNSLVVGALAGQTVVIRYPRLPDMPEGKLDEAIEKEAGQHIPYDLSEVFLDWTLLDTISQGQETLLKVLLVAAKHDVIDTRAQLASAAELEYSILSVDSVALADAAEGCDIIRRGETLALINIGLSSASIHFIKDGVSNFIRDITWGGRELIQAIARARHCEQSEAERLLCDPAAFEPDKPQSPEPPPLDAFFESAAPAEPAPEPNLAASDLLDPFEDELDKAEPTPAIGTAPAVETSDSRPLTDILSMPLSRLVSEIRRSFDYYEHELYESPVDRIVLSGGIAELPILCDMLSEELGIKDVEVANPADGALVVGRSDTVAPFRAHPAQFMVAIGLAARGSVDL